MTRRGLLLRMSGRSRDRVHDGAVATVAAMSAAITAEDLLAALRIDGGPLETSDAFDTDALIAQSRDGQPEWAL